MPWWAWGLAVSRGLPLRGFWLRAELSGACGESLSWLRSSVAQVRLCRHFTPRVLYKWDSGIFRQMADVVRGSGGGALGECLGRSPCPHTGRLGWLCGSVLGPLREAQVSERTVCLRVTAGPHGGWPALRAGPWGAPPGSALQLVPQRKWVQAPAPQAGATWPQKGVMCMLLCGFWPRTEQTGFSWLHWLSPSSLSFPLSPKFLACCTGFLLTGQGERWEQGDWTFLSKCHWDLELSRST